MNNAVILPSPLPAPPDLASLPPTSHPAREPAPAAAMDRRRRLRREIAPISSDIPAPSSPTLLVRLLNELLLGAPAVVKACNKVDARATFGRVGMTLVA